MFQFKQFTIRQDRTPMKVGTDGVLLGAWAEIENATNILDIGTGTGLLALMCAQRNSSARIDAIEIEPHAYGQALENIRESPWQQRIRVFPCSLQQYTSPLRYDGIICNPPFFINSTKAPESGRTLARHNDALPLEELVENVVRLLTPTGHFFVILPPAEANLLIRYARAYRLYPQRITDVLPNPGKMLKRQLLHLSTTIQEIIEDEIIIELSRHHYSEEYRALTQAFYLNL